MISPKIPAAFIAVGHPDHACVRDDNVEAAELPKAFGDNGVHGFGITHICLACQDPAAVSLDQLHRFVEIFDRRTWIVGEVEPGADIESDDVRAVAGQLDCMRTAHTACGAGDERDPAVEAAHHHSFGKLTSLVTASHSSIEAENAASLSRTALSTSRPRSSLSGGSSRVVTISTASATLRGSPGR